VIHRTEPKALMVFEEPRHFFTYLLGRRGMKFVREDEHIHRRTL